MKKLFLTSALTLCISCPAFANIDKDASSATCDNATIGTTTGPANLQADWTANRINLDWYDGDTKLTVGTSSATCTYDSSITLPSTPQVPAGYTFGGWKVRIPTFDLGALAQYISTNGDRYYCRGWYNNADYCYALGTDTVNTGGANVCVQESDALSDIALGEWKTVFSYGILRGVAYCSGKSGDNHNFAWAGNISDWIATESELTSASGIKQYCWCKPTGFDAEKDGTYQPVEHSWVFDSDYGNAADCAYYCESDCGSRIMDGYACDAFRTAMFGQNQ